MSNLFFVYGTLQRGYGNNSILRDSTFIQSDVTEGRYYLGDVGYPYAFPKYRVSSWINDDCLLPVRGEVWEVEDPKVVQRLDWLEGEGHHYHRRLTRTQSGETVNIYEQLDSTMIGTCRPCYKLNGEWKWQP